MSRARTSVDPVTLEVIRNSLPAIANEMAADLQRASYNMMIYEVQDFSCALLNADGDLLAQNSGGVSHFVADMGFVVRDGLKRYGPDGFAPGDVIVHNHQRVGGQHLNNMCIYVPIFHGERLIGFGANRAHWVDVGGLSTGFGSYELAFDPWVEGLQLDQIKLWKAGELDEQMLRFIGDNIRMPEAAFGDLRAQISACELAGRRLVELYNRYGTPLVEESIRRIFEMSEQRCRRIVAEIPDGTYTAESYLDPLGADREPVEIRVSVTVAGSDMTIDLSGCSPQRRAAINSRTLAGGLIAYKALTTPTEPVNEGSFGAVKVVIPEGNMMMASFPAPMAGWSVALPTVVETIFRALADVMPDRIPASHHCVLGPALVFTGIDSKGRRFVSQSIEGGGWGGRPGEDGPSAAVSICQGDVRNAPIENLELKVPLLIEERAFRPDSGGPGKFRGGLGIATRARNLLPGRWALDQTQRRELAPWGLAGGKPGKISDCLVRAGDGETLESIEPGNPWRDYDAGAVVEVRSAGGGGWGDPYERDTAQVLADVLREFVSVAAARNDYGVVIDPVSMLVDEAATAALRARPADGERVPDAA